MHWYPAIGIFGPTQRFQGRIRADRLFVIEGLNPRPAFRVTGEQIPTARLGKRFEADSAQFHTLPNANVSTAERLLQVVLRSNRVRP
jgi:hypothetical protein